MHMHMHMHMHKVTFSASDLAKLEPDLSNVWDPVSGDGIDPLTYVLVDNVIFRPVGTDDKVCTQVVCLTMYTSSVFNHLHKWCV